MGNGSSTDDSCGNVPEFSYGLPKLEPLKFHEVCSRGTIISPNRMVMRRFDQGYGFAFSNRAIQAEEIICFRIVMFHKGTLRLGLIARDPASMQPRELEDSLFHNSQTVFIKEVSDSATRKNNLIFFKLNQSGEVVYGWQKKDKDRDKGVLFSGVPMSSPVWAVIVMSGRNLAIKLEGENIMHIRTKSFRKTRKITRVKSMDVLEITNNEEKVSSSSTTDREFNKSHRVKEKTARPRSFSVSGPSYVQLMPTNSTQETTSEFITDNPSLLPTRPAVNTLLQTDPVNNNLSQTQVPRKCSKKPQNGLENQCKMSMCFHCRVGKNVNLSSDRIDATRRTGKNNGYVFTRRPIQLEEKIIIVIKKLNSNFQGGLGFGLTVCDPTLVCEFPDDPDELLDREEYWVFMKDVCNNLNEGDQLTFIITRKGEVGMSKNDDSFRTIFYIDPSLTYWAVFDISGSVEKISCLGTMVQKRSSRASTKTASTGRTLDHYVTNASIERGTNVDTSSVTPSSSAGTTTTPRTSQNRSVNLVDIFGEVSLIPTPPLIPVPSGVLQPAGNRIPSQKPVKTPQTSDRTPVRVPDPFTKTRATMSMSHKEAESLLNAISQKPSFNPSNEPKEEVSECSVCLENVPDCALYTCGHVCLCFECGQNIIKSNNPLCPVCRQPIKDVIKIYKS